MKMIGFDRQSPGKNTNALISGTELGQSKVIDFGGR